MKTYKHLFEQLISEENIILAIKNTSRGKKNQKNIKKVADNLNNYIERYRNAAYNYKNKKHKPKEIYDGISHKKRVILVPSFDEQVMHHMIVNILKPIFMHSMYEYSCGSVPGRGAHGAKKKLEKWIQNDLKNTTYCLKMDVRKFFDSIPHNILKEKLSRIIKDDKFLAILFEIIDVQEIGIPIGFYTSQWLSNFYLTELDHSIKQDLHAKYYIRYMDDMVILGGDKQQLHVIRQKINDYLVLKLGLELKSNWQVFKIQDYNCGRPIDFMGFKFSKYNTTLRWSIIKKIGRKAKTISSAPRITVFSCRQMLSYFSWINSSDTYNFYLLFIKPYIGFKYLKKRISLYDKKYCYMNSNSRFLRPCSA